MISHAAGSIFSSSGMPIGFSGGTSGSIHKMHTPDIARTNQPCHHRVINTNLAGSCNMVNWLKYEEAITFGVSYEDLKSSIESPNTVRPSWVKTGKDFVKWMQSRRKERINNGDGTIL